MSNVNIGKFRALPHIALWRLLRVRGPGIRQLARYVRRAHPPCEGTGLVRTPQGVQQCGCGPWILHLEARP